MEHDSSFCVCSLQIAISLECVATCNIFTLCHVYLKIFWGKEFWRSVQKAKFMRTQSIYINI